MLLLSCFCCSLGSCPPASVAPRDPVLLLLLLLGVLSSASVTPCGSVLLLLLLLGALSSCFCCFLGPCSSDSVRRAQTGAKRAPHGPKRAQTNAKRAPNVPKRIPHGPKRTQTNPKRVPSPKIYIASLFSPKKD